MRTRLEELKKYYDVNVKNACFTSYNLFLDNEDPEQELPDFEGFATKDGCAYEPNFLGQFGNSMTVDEDRTNKFCQENGFNNFSEWVFELEIAIYWDGGNWCIEMVKNYSGDYLPASDNYESNCCEEKEEQ
jgi:hypothetical protein